MMDLIYFIIGLIVGGTAVFFICKNKFGNENVISGAELENLKTDKVRVDERYSVLERTLNAKEQDLKNEREKTLGLTADLSKIRESNSNLISKLEDQKREFEDLQQKFASEFENLANRIFDDKSKKIAEQNRENIGQLLDPLRTKIDEFKTKVEYTYKVDSEERISLKTEIQTLMKFNQKISDQANNLATALRGDSKKQGDWGEKRLELILEKAGLQENIHYRKQAHLTNEQGDTKIPDFIINLPDDRNLIIDSKVSTNAYTDYCNAITESDKALFLKQHLESIKRHVVNLSEQDYQHLYGINAPDYVLMYVPIEPALYVALQSEADLHLWALDKKNVIFTTTSTLLAIVSTVSYIWKQESQKRYVLEIARQAGSLYDKFVAMIENFEEVGSKLDDAKKFYEEAMNKLHTGKGNLISKVENIKQLGAKTSKSLPQDLIDSAKEEDVSKTIDSSDISAN